jgi:hypothetical protein
MSTSTAWPAVEAVPTPLLGRCVECKAAFRVDIPAGTRVITAMPAAAMRAAGMPAVWCGCRAGVRCGESPLGLPGCGDSFCGGHPQTAVKFAAVKVTIKPEVHCGGKCWAARSSNCACDCGGKNHGGQWGMVSAR